MTIESCWHAGLRVNEFDELSSSSEEDDDDEQAGLRNIT